MDSAETFQLAITRVPLTDLRYCGMQYRMRLNVTDALTIPPAMNTVVDIGKPAGYMRPLYWPSNAKNPAVRVEVESVSDAGTPSICDEAIKAWDNFEYDVAKQQQWLELLGVHKDILVRMEEPLTNRIVVVRTAFPNFLTLMFTFGSYAVASAASHLRYLESIGQVTAAEPEELHNFLFRQDQRIPAGLKDRYARACAGDFSVFEFHTADQKV